MKLAENVSPLPENRVFMNYSLFKNVPLTSDGIEVNRFTPGFEKAFLQKQVSLEFRAPFRNYPGQQYLHRWIDQHIESRVRKPVLRAQGAVVVNGPLGHIAGLSISVPTADDNRVLNANGTELLRVVNQSVHIMPFIGGSTLQLDAASFKGYSRWISIPTETMSSLVPRPPECVRSARFRIRRSCIAT